MAHQSASPEEARVADHILFKKFGGHKHRQEFTAPNGAVHVADTRQDDLHDSDHMSFRDLNIGDAFSFRYDLPVDRDRYTKTGDWTWSHPDWPNGGRVGSQHVPVKKKRLI